MWVTKMPLSARVKKEEFNHLSSFLADGNVAQEEMRLSPLQYSDTTGEGDVVLGAGCRALDTVFEINVLVAEGREDIE